MLIASIQGSMYYMFLIDDVSRKTWIHFMKTRDEAFNLFQELKTLVENQIGKNIQIQGEFGSNTLISMWINVNSISVGKHLLHVFY